MYKDTDGVWKSRFITPLDGVSALLDMNNQEHYKAFMRLYDVCHRVETDYDKAIKIVQELRMEIFELKKNK